MTDPAAEKKKYPWLVYIALLLAGLILIVDVYPFFSLDRLAARLGIALFYSAFALFVGSGRRTGIIGTVIIWVAVVATMFI